MNVLRRCICCKIFHCGG